ncbi:hypothetical protein AJ79_03574 [Helicocarpus griseus UAMH5409]|uniref:TauD/TfdA-like domain-containing protein n=1 Tax=Helicocarpus griseus UAMH5409 TaxID=1447875 RepID=A0A2B7XXT1_9EURO|nr:hypothetical protein AJ79_03574 [Helicocarpus griseus UAMH5409]
MAPSVVDVPEAVATEAGKSMKDVKSLVTPSTGLKREPLKLSGALDQFESFDVTPVIGREFKNVNLKKWLRAPNSDELIRDLAITISQRGVVFFRAQDDLDNELQKELARRLGELSGKPSTSKLHIHPVANSGRQFGGKDDEISVISSEQAKQIYKSRFFNLDKKQSARQAWHSDITFEPVPSDYAILRLTELPASGGDTMWASGYEVYDRISKPYQKFLETLTATYAQPGFGQSAKENGFELYSGERGAPENVGDELKAIHPVIRTNPVTGWKSVFAVGTHVARVNDVSEAESEHLLKWFVTLIVENHDLQVRLKWQNKNDLAIWDNRSVYHAATYDYEGLGPRTGQRAVSLGERPYLDPNSIGRTEALAAAQE